MRAPYPDHTVMRHYVYRFLNADGRLIYVGCTYNTDKRFAFHKANMWWADQVDRIKIKVYPNKALAREAEKWAIRNENPRWNILGKFAYMSEWIEQDFLDYIAAIENSGVALADVRRQRLQKAKDVYAERFGSIAA